MKYIKVFLKKKNKKSDNMVVKDTKIFKKTENKLFEYKKTYYKMRKSVLL